MKKIAIVIVIVLNLFICSVPAIAKSYPLPDVNTDAEINFQGFEWYSDYRETLKAVSARGIEYNDDWILNNFELDYARAAHWQVLLNSVWNGAEKGCGGYLQLYENIPDVAGYHIYDLVLYMMFNPEKGATEQFKSEDAVQFYMAKYRFDVTDNIACYTDIVGKLKKLYGNNPESAEKSGTKYSLWVNSEGALVGISCDKYFVDLLYMAPGAEDRLTNLELDIAAKEIENAADDMSGL